MTQALKNNLPSPTLEVNPGHGYHHLFLSLQKNISQEMRGWEQIEI
jgi:hypothetical protein